MKKIAGSARRPILFICVAALALTSCASIPKEAPELSMELGKRISAIEAAHMALLRQFFDEKRAEIDRFIEEEWIPVFTEEFFSQPAIVVVWDTIVSENNVDDRGRFVTMIGAKMQDRINAKRQELIAPLDEIEAKLERRLRDEYDQARAINNSITSYLSSASEVDATRSRYLQMVGISDEEIANTIDSVDRTVGKLNEIIDAGADRSRLEQLFLEQMNNIIESFISGGKGDAN